MGKDQVVKSAQMYGNVPREWSEIYKCFFLVLRVVDKKQKEHSVKSQIRKISGSG